MHLACVPFLVSLFAVAAVPTLAGEMHGDETVIACLLSWPPVLKNTDYA
jgi:hypothetical protein